MKKLLIILSLFIICGCEKTYEGDESDKSLAYGGWRSRPANLRLKMIMNHLGIKEEDFVIHRVETALEFDDVVHKKTETCELCNKEKK